MATSKTISAGALYASGYAAVVDTLVNHGTIAGTGVAGGLVQSLTLDNDGKVVGSISGVRLPNGGGVPNRAGGTIRGSIGIVASEQAAVISNAGIIGGTSGDGFSLMAISLTAGGRVDNLAGGTLGLPRITFLPGRHQTLLLGNPASVSGTIDGFGATDVIDLHGVGHASATSFAGDTLSISTPAGAVSLHFAGPCEAGNFAIADDGHGGTNLTYS